MSNDWMRDIHIGIPPQEGEPKDVREMRQIIDRTGLDCPIIYRTQCTARHLGLSGEDKYTLLAYSALLELHRMHKANTQWLMSQPVRTIIVDHPRKK